jgi:hypothetical protein
MLGFLVLLGMLLSNVLGCGVLFFAGQTGLLVPLAVLFFVLYGLTAFRAGRGVEFRSPLAPRSTSGQQRQRTQRRPAAEANEFGLD